MKGQTTLNHCRFVFYHNIDVKLNDPFNAWPLRETLTRADHSHRQRQIGQLECDITANCGKNIKTYSCSLPSASSITAPTAIVLEDLGTHPTPRLSFGHAPSEQLVSKHSMEIMKMDEELNNFRRDWQEKRTKMLERHQRERAVSGLNGDTYSSLTPLKGNWVYCMTSKWTHIVTSLRVIITP